MDQTMLSVPGVEIVEVAGISADGRPLVRREEDEGPRPADVVWMAAEPSWRDCLGCRAVVAFERGDSSRPIVLGILDAPAAPAEKRPRNLRIESDRELVIQCGKSKIALRSDGRIEIRGGHLISRSSGPNKVKGASVHIN